MRHIKYKVGDQIELSEEGKRAHVDKMAEWKGVVMDHKGAWVRVLWLKPIKQYTEHIENIRLRDIS